MLERPRKKESGKKHACCKLVFFKVSRAVNLALKITNWQNEVLHKYCIKDPGLYDNVECTAKKIDKWLNFVSLYSPLKGDDFSFCVFFSRLRGLQCLFCSAKALQQGLHGLQFNEIIFTVSSLEVPQGLPIKRNHRFFFSTSTKKSTKKTCKSPKSPIRGLIFWEIDPLGRKSKSFEPSKTILTKGSWWFFAKHHPHVFHAVPRNPKIRKRSYFWKDRIFLVVCLYKIRLATSLTKEIVKIATRGEKKHLSAERSGSHTPQSSHHLFVRNSNASSMWSHRSWPANLSRTQLENTLQISSICELSVLCLVQIRDVRHATLKELKQSFNKWNQMNNFS